MLRTIDVSLTIRHAGSFFEEPNCHTVRKLRKHAPTIQQEAIIVRTNYLALPGLHHINERPIITEE